MNSPTRQLHLLLKGTCWLAMLAALWLLLWGSATPALAQTVDWTWENPLPQGNALNAVWGSSATDQFAVGEGGMILHYDGLGWTPMTSGTTITLTGIWGSGPTDVFAVGHESVDKDNVRTYRDIILHYDGHSWRVVLSQTEVGFTAVWGSGSKDVFAVGLGAIYHYDGVKWTPMWQDDYLGLLSVWGSGPTDVYAVRYADILHYDGSRWRFVPDVPSGVFGLRQIWGSEAKDIFAVGTASILHYDGITWSATAIPDDTNLYGVWGNSPTDVFAVGYDGAVLHYDGAGWSPMATGVADWFLGVGGVAPPTSSRWATAARSSATTAIAGPMSGPARSLICWISGAAVTTIAMPWGGVVICFTMTAQHGRSNPQAWTAFSPRSGAAVRMTFLLPAGRQRALMVWWCTTEVQAGYRRQSVRTFC